MISRKLFFACVGLAILILATACGQDASSLPMPKSVSEIIIFASDRDGDQFHYMMAPDGANLQMISLGEFPSRALIDRPTWSEKSGKYFFSATVDGNSDIYSVEPGGNNLVNLTNTPTIFEASIVLSPDGEYIAFIAMEYEANVEIMKPDGSERLDVSNFAGRYGSIQWAPDSSRILFVSNRSGTPNVFSVKTDGTELINISKGPGLDATFSLSPGGDRIVFDSDRDGAMDIFLVDVSGENMTNITNHPARDVGPIWSPDGQRVAFRSDRDGGWDIYVITLSDNSVTRLTDTPDVDESVISWSPDGQHLIYNSKIQDQSDVFSLALDGSPPENLTNNPANDYGAIWISIK